MQLMYLVAYKSVRTLLLELTTQTESALRKKSYKNVARTSCAYVCKTNKFANFGL